MLSFLSVHLCTLARQEQHRSTAIFPPTHQTKPARYAWNSAQSALATLPCLKAGSASDGFDWPPNACRASGSGASPSICPADCRWVRPRISTRPSRSFGRLESAEGQNAAGATRGGLQGYEHSARGLTCRVCLTICGCDARCFRLVRKVAVAF